MRGRRDLLVILGCASVAGCGRTQLDPGAAGVVATGGAGGAVGAGGAAAFTQTFAGTGRDLDLLFMIDDSASMQPIISKLVQNFPALEQVLVQPPGLPSIHIAVVSSDLGAGPAVGIPRCTPGGDGGLFHRSALVVLDSSARFISNVNGVANYDQSMGLTAAFASIANVGEMGCGFEHQIASVARALGADGAAPPPGNDGFLRPDAWLAIVFVTNEDDCSAPPDTGLFDVGSESVRDPLGPMQSYRCNEFGHLCNGAPPPRTMAASFPAGACVPAEDRGKLIPVATLAAEIKSLKADPTKILVSVIAGPPDPYDVVMVDAVPNTQDALSGVKWPNVAHSCTAGTDEYGDPGVRLKALVDAFGPNGLYVPVCAPSLAGAFQTIAVALDGRQPRCLASVPPASCTLTAGGTTVPVCPGTAGAPCFRFVAAPACAGSGLALVVDSSTLLPQNADETLHCSN